MATMDKPELRIDVDATGPNPSATLTVSYTVHWDSYDQASNQPYGQSWVLWGGDAGAGEDGVDDRITGSGVLGLVVFASDGATESEREIVITHDLPFFDEDPGANLDELKVEVILDPQEPRSATEFSNRVLVSA